MKKETIEQMLISNQDNLNLFFNERRLIILALKKSNFNLQIACDFNFDNMELETYKNMLYTKYKLSLKELKLYFKNK